MPRESSSPGSPDEWLIVAQSDLALAHTAKSEEILFETLCFHAQQAAEKALKAVLLHFGKPIPRTHVIEDLMTAISAHIEIPSQIRQAAALTPYATTFKYPGDYESLTETDFLEKLASAERTFAWAKQICG